MTPIPIGSWEVLRPGEQIAIVAIGPMIGVAEEAADLLKREGINPRIINARFVKPLDEAMLRSLAEDGMQIIVLEEGSELGGLGSAVMEFYSQQQIYGINVRIIGVPDVFVEHGSVKEQRAETGLTAERVAADSKAMMPRRTRLATGQ
jgi:1-deoxy-D-xylulose-5-phosphate synthase